MADEIKRDTVDYRDPTPFDNTKLNSLSDISKALRHKTYGEDTREAIAQQGEALAKLMQETGGNQSAEVAAARGNFELLGIREDAQDNAIAVTNSNLANKADKTYIDDYLSQVSYVPETVASLDELKTKYPNGKPGLFITADNGHKYIWTNGAWKDAGVYQSQGIASNSVGKDKQQAVTMPGVFASAYPIDFNFKKGVASVSSGAFFNKENLATNVSAHTFGIKPNSIGWIVFDNASKQFELNDSPTNDETVVGWVWNGSAFVYGAKITVNGISAGQRAVKEGSLATIFSNLPIIVDRDKGVIRFKTQFTVHTQDGVNSVVKLESDGGTQPNELNIADNGSGSSWDWLYFDKDYQRIVFGSKNVVGEGYYAGYSLNSGQSVLLNGTRNVITNNGVNIACLGDSFTEGIGTKKRYFEYWQDLLFADNIQANFTPFGVGSTTVADTGWKPEGSFVKRHVQIPDNTDIATILGGANDFNFGSVLGEVNSTDATTYCGGLNTIIDGLRKKNPLMTIICMTPTKAYYEDHNWDEWGNSQGLHLIDYVNAMKAVCQVKSVECVDLYSDSGYNPIDVNVRAAMSSDGLHPNEKGHEKLARCSYSTIRNQVITYD